MVKTHHSLEAVWHGSYVAVYIEQADHFSLPFQLHSIGNECYAHQVKVVMVELQLQKVKIYHQTSYQRVQCKPTPFH